MAILKVIGALLMSTTALLLLGFTNTDSEPPPVCPSGSPLVIKLSLEGVADDIQLVSWTFGQTQSAIPSSGGAGKLDVHDIHFTKTHDASSPKLFLDCASGNHIPSATLDVCSDPGCNTKILQYTMQDVIVSSYETGSSSSSDCTPTEQVSLNFAEVKIDYVAEDQKTTVQRKGKKWTVVAPSPS
jgi:type VI secretion system secreted protein Hcp